MAKTMRDSAKHPQWHLSAETFVIPLDNGEIALFVPRKGIVARVNKSAACVARDAVQSTRYNHSNSTHVLAALTEAEILNAKPGIAVKVYDETEFQPTCVSLLLTTACNLRCVYCYANGGEAKMRTLSPDIAKAGIDLAAQHAIQKGDQAFSVNFHGAGEPTLAWSLYRQLVGHARDVAERHGLRACINTCTNGLMSGERAKWMARNTEYASLSLDGTADVQDAMRPRPNGQGSFATIQRTLQIFDEEHFSYMVRGTVCESNVAVLPEFVAWLCDNCNADVFQFEPMMRDGRCFSSRCKGPDPAMFVTAFNTASKVAATHGRVIGFSTISLHHLRTYHCLAEADAFTVTHDGLLSACFGVTDLAHAQSDTFIYGRFVPQTGSFEISHEKLATLRRRNTGHKGNLSACAKCFCKYFCCGDCALNSLRAGLPLTVGSRCTITRAVATNLIRELFGLSAAQCAPQSIREGIRLEVDDGLASFRPSRPHATPAEVLDVRRYEVRESDYMRAPDKDETIRRLLERGNTLSRLNRTESAYHTYEVILRQDKDCVAALVNSAVLLMRMCKIEEALIRLRRAHELAPAASEVNVNMARALAAAGFSTEAIATLRRTAEVERAAAPACLMLAWLLLLENNIEEALPLLESIETEEGGQEARGARQMLEICRWEEVWLQKTEDIWGSEFVRMLRSNLTAGLDDDILAVFLDTASLVAARQYPLVLKRLNEGGSACSAPLLYHWLSGLCLVRMGRCSEADAHLAKSIPLLPRLYLEPAPLEWRLLADGWNCRVDGGKAVAVVPGIHHFAVESTGRQGRPRRCGHTVNIGCEYDYVIGLSGMKMRRAANAYRGPL